MFRLDGKVALVTGAAGGLGRAISVALAKAGADVAIVDRPGVSLDETAREVVDCGGQACGLDLDVCCIDQIPGTVSAIEEQFGRIDILVNNAGTNRPMAGLEMTEEAWDAVYNTNVKSGLFIAQAVARTMVPRGWGRIIFIASQSGIAGMPGHSSYCSSKAAVIQLARTLGLEWMRHGITVNAIAPTYMETNLTRKRLQDEEWLRFVLGKLPGGRIATPEEVASAAVYLSSDEAAMVNSSVLLVDGGWTAW